MNIAQKVLKNTGVVFFGQVIILGLNLIVMVYMARYFGEAQFGMFSFAIVFVSYFAILPDFGMKPIIVREIARKRDKAPTIIGTSIIVKFIFSIIAIILTILTAILIGYSKELVIIILMLSFTILITSKLQTFREVFESIFEADLKMEFPFLFRIIDAVVLAGLISLLIYLRRSLAEITFSYVISTLLGFLLIVILSIRHTKLKIKLDSSLAKWLIVQSAPLAIYVALTRFYMNADIFFLKMLKGDAAVGYYSAAHRLITPLNFIPSAIVMSLFPLMSKFYQDSKEKLTQSFYFCLKILLLMGLAFGLGTTFLHERLIVFLYTEKYLSSAVPLMLLMWAECLIFLSFFLVDFHTSVNQQRRNTHAAVIMFVSNVILNLFFIPGGGIVGAAVAKLLTILIGFSMLFYSAQQIIEFSPFQIIKKIIPIAVCFSTLLYLIQSWNLILIFIISPLFFICFIIAFKFFSVNERKVLKELLIKIKF